MTTETRERPRSNIIKMKEKAQNECHHLSQQTAISSYDDN